MELLLKRGSTRKTCTIGKLFINGAKDKECYILEDVVREIAGKPVTEWKVYAETAIPIGRYKIIWSHSSHFNAWMPELVEVPGFEGVRIHAGNTAEDTEGCFITGMAIGLDGERVVRSKEARDALYAKIKAAVFADEQVWITIVKGD